MPQLIVVDRGPRYAHGEEAVPDAATAGRASLDSVCEFAGTLRRATSRSHDFPYSPHVTSRSHAAHYRERREREVTRGYVSAMSPEVV